tara:strand:+ start:9423 stop:10307 length:885 start_codon:yes stop_codon:yes gene_type:complete
MSEEKELLPNRDIDLREAGGLIFYEKEHAYYNADGVKYTGMTTFLKAFEGENFDADKTSKYKAIKEVLSDVQMKKLKAIITKELHEPSRTAWTKVHLFFEKLCDNSTTFAISLPAKQQEFLDAWEKSAVDGSIEHDKREKEIMEHGVTWNGKYYPFMNKNILEITKDDVCVIPEIMVWNHETQLCGLIDLPIFDKGVCHILDYKTNKQIEKSGFMGRKMKQAFKFHPDCNFSKYSAQLHGYQKMACELTGFEPGECWIISTASKEYKRKEDVFIECIDMSTEINEAFKTFKYLK